MMSGCGIRGKHCKQMVISSTGGLEPEAYMYVCV